MKLDSFHGSDRSPRWSVSESQLLPIAEACPFCGGTSRSPVATVQQDPAIVLLKCRNCHLCSVSRMPTEETLREFYAHFYDEWEGPGESRITFDEPGRLARRIAVALRHVPEHLRILDFGGGDATVSRMVAEFLIRHGRCRNATIDLIEWSTVVPPSPKDIQIRVKDAIPEGDCSFDLAIASAILEHLPHPRQTLASLLNRLQPGGTFYARTPYVAPLLRLLPGMRNDLFPFPTHLHDMGQHFWNRVLTTLGVGSSYVLAKSRPSIVEFSWKHHPPQWFASNVMKAPWYLLRGYYGLVGGWEVFIQAK